MEPSASHNTTAIPSRRPAKVTKVYGKIRDLPPATRVEQDEDIHESEREAEALGKTSVDDIEADEEVDEDNQEQLDISDPFGLKQSLRNIEDDFETFRVQNESSSSSSISKTTCSTESTANTSLQLLDTSPFNSSLTPLSSSLEQAAEAESSQHIRRPSTNKRRPVPSPQSSPISPDPFAMESPKRTPPSPLTSSPERERQPEANPIDFDSSLQSIEDDSSFAAASDVKGKGKGRATQRKRLTKKALKEAAVDKARDSEKSTFVLRKSAESLPITALLQKMSGNKGTPQVSPKRKYKEASSDPIQSFTSPDCTQANTTAPVTTTTHDNSDIFDLKSDDEDEFMPDASRLLQETSERKRNKEMLEKLIGEKRRIVQLQSNTLREDKSDEEDDLEVVDNMISSSPPSAGELHKMQDKGSTTNRKKGKGVISDRNLKQLFETAARPTFERRSSRSARYSLSHKDLGNLTFQRAMQQSKDITKRKEDEWIQKGGRLKNKVLEDRGMADFANINLQSGDDGQGEGMDEDEAGSDSDYEPVKQGSVSPGSNASRRSRDIDDEDEQSADEQEHSPTSARMTDVDEDVFGEPSRGRTRQPPHRQRRVVSSDDENDENALPQRRGRILVPDTSIMDAESLDVYNQAYRHRGSASSLDVTSTDDDNKENDNRLMYDHSEDKENTAVPRHLPVDLRDSRPLNRRTASGLSSLEEGFRRRLSMSPSLDDRDDRSLERQPLGDLEDPSLFPQSASSKSHGKKVATEPTFFTTSRSGTQSPSPNRPNLLQPAFGDELAPPNFSFSDDEDGTRDAENVTTKTSSPSEPVPMQLGGLSQLFSAEEETTGFNARSDDLPELSLTMDVKLQPALEISTQVRKQGDAIFEKEQEFVIEDANQNQRAVPDLYITEAGLLTQTRPEDSTPVVYRHLPATQGSGLKSQWSTRYLSSTQRQPLGTLSFTSDIQSPSQPYGLSRLVKGRQRDPDEQMLLEPGPSKPNAFQIMLQAERKQNAKSKKQLAKNSEYIEGEAQESDEDEMRGFGRKTADDEEESEDEDPSVHLKELVDDVQMDTDTLAADLVQEKFQEHQALDDAEIEKLHQAAIAGKLRSKRRGGRIGFDDSDDDESDDEAKRVRARMFKKRKVDGDTLDTLGEESQSFKAAYHKDLDDDADDDFAHLKQDHMEVVDEDEIDEDDEDENQPITYSEMTKKFQEIARSNEARQGFDPEDVSWAGPPATQDEDEELHIKEVISILKKSTSSGKQLQRQADIDLDIERFARPSNPIEQERLQLWQKEHGSSSRTFASSSAAAVTGHGQQKSARGLGQSKADSTEHEKPKVVVKSASILASVTDKQSRFE